MIRFVVLLSLIALTAGAAIRPPWTNSRITGSPHPPAPYRVKIAFPLLNFTNPIEMMPEPGADRFYVAELNGKIFRFENRRGAVAREVADLKRDLPKFLRLLGFQFDPGFQKNGHVYVCINTENKTPEGSRISRFTIRDTNPPTLDPESERVIIKWRSGGHNGCAIHFGEDGFMYFSTGDAEAPSPPDSLDTGQDISDILGSIQRIDVHRSEGRKNYAIPADNPFVKHPGARPEVWAYGFRNPWRMSFDPETGHLFVGDVGWELWEMIYDVVKGGNYGWAITEGPQPVKPDQEPGPTPILKPLISHSHVEAMSITGGYVYRGNRLPELRGHWIYGDYVTGKIWSFRHDGKSLSGHSELLDSHIRVVCFGRDHAGEVYIVDYEGQIYRLEKNEETAANKSFPRKLSETGLFADIRKQLPAEGVVPYEVQAEQWLGGARAQRFVAIPGDGQVSYHKRNNLARGVLRDAFAFPADTVIARTISVPKPPRHIETQILHFNGEGWLPYNYVWNEEQTEAHLSDGQGADIEFSFDDGGGELVKRPWRLHSSTECMTCHMARPGYVLGLHHQYSDVGSQHADWVASGLLEKKPKPLHWLKQEGNLQRQARAYLHINCAHCHRRGGGGTAPFELRADQQLERNRLFETAPNQGAFGMYDPKIIVPGDAGRSLLLYRMASTGGAHMPKLGPRSVDWQGLQLVRAWINELADEPITPSWLPENDWQHMFEHVAKSANNLGNTGSGTRENALTKQINLPSNLFQDTANSLNYLMSGCFSIEEALARLSQMPPHIYDLFESFFPNSKKRKILGPTIDSAQVAEVLSLKGDATNGAKLFRQVDRTQCINCHRIGEEGREVGPELARIGEKYSRAQLLESLVKPSRYIDPRFQSVSIDLKSGVSYTGYIVSREDGNTVLRDLTGTNHTIKPYLIESTTRGKLSLMPEGLLQSFTPQEAADLVAYLESLN